MDWENLYWGGGQEGTRRIWMEWGRGTQHVDIYTHTHTHTHTLTGCLATILGLRIGGSATALSSTDDLLDLERGGCMCFWVSAV